MSEVAERFSRDLAEVCWRDLRIHLQRDVVILVAADLDLVAAATAVASDDKGRIENWIAQNMVAKPSREQIALWETHLDKPFRMLIVQPFILLQEIVHA